MLESKVSVSAGVHLAAARSCVTMADLDGPSLCKVDPYEGGPIAAKHTIDCNDLLAHESFLLPEITEYFIDLKVL